MSVPTDLDPRAAALRREFDAAFAVAQAAGGEERVPLLGLRIRGDAYAVPLTALRGLAGDWQAVPLPGASPALHGLAGIRGELVPVYDLGAVLGYPGNEACRWLALLAGGQPLAVAFAGCTGITHIPASELAAATGAGDDRLVLHRHGPVPLINVAAVIAAVIALTTNSLPPARSLQP